VRRKAFRAILPGAAFIFMMNSVALAHVVCGDRVFPTTLTMDDPGVSDEVSLPTIAMTPDVVWAKQQLRVRMGQDHHRRSR
jgi:hypothetical protein